MKIDFGRSMRCDAHCLFRQLHLSRLFRFIWFSDLSLAHHCFVDQINLIKLSEIEQKAQMGEKMKLSINRASEVWSLGPL
jgi:hypothetical protein